MGLLDKLFMALTSVQDTGAHNNTPSSQPSASSAAPAPAKRTNAGAQRTLDECVAYFDSLLCGGELNGYEIEKNVHPSVFDQSAHPRCFPITFLLKRDSSPVLAVIIMKDSQRTTMPVFGTKTILDNAGIAHLNFYYNMPNEENYVLDRIKKHL